MTKQEFLQGVEFRLYSRWYKFESLGHDDPLQGCIMWRHDSTYPWVHCANIDRISKVGVTAYSFWLHKEVRTYLKFAALPTGLPQKALNHNSAA